MKGGFSSFLHKFRLKKLFSEIFKVAQEIFNRFYVHPSCSISEIRDKSVSFRKIQILKTVNINNFSEADDIEFPGFLFIRDMVFQKSVDNPLFSG